MKDFLASVASLLVIVGAVSIAPDSWFLEKFYDISRQTADNRSEIQAGRIERDEIIEELAIHLDQHNEDARVIAQAINDARLLTEEKYLELSIQIRVNALETKIAELTSAIAREQAEVDRLDRVINGKAAAPASEETYRSRRRSVQYIDAYNSQLDAAVRELNRLMIPQLPGLNDAQ